MFTWLKDFQKNRHILLASAIILIALFSANSCGKGKSDGATREVGESPMGQREDSVEVSVKTIEPEEVTLTQELPGRISAYRIAEVRARVDGIIEKRLYNEGAAVAAGTILYQIDPSSYEAKLHGAQASLVKAQSNADSAKLKEQRYKKLVQERVSSMQNYEDAAAALYEHQADILSAKADLETAQIDLDYTRVNAPISGIVGISEVTEGAYVRQSEATLMTTIRQIDPVYVDITQSTAELLRLRNAISSGEIDRNGKELTGVKLLLEDGTEYGHDGKIVFTDTAVSTSASSIKLRAVFPNPDQKLLPGMFVRARLIDGKKSKAILIPQSSASRNEQGKPTVYVVNPDNTAALRTIEVTRAIGNHWLVKAGLTQGDTLILDNLQRVKDGIKVKTQSAVGQHDGGAEH